ncbi:MAG TPA: SDR family NAD(P)-dependent oxidoreductase, partial [Nordella sp.]|nr:SDR family NAD(P)-dependent oxidoreductase [Nordella sp.]
MRLERKIAVVTGGARGIGRAIAEGYAREGARVCIADIDEAAAREAARDTGGGAFAAHLDVTRLDSINRLVETVETTAGGLDILVNNAAIF